MYGLRSKYSCVNRLNDYVNLFYTNNSDTIYPTGGGFWTQDRP